MELTARKKQILKVVTERYIDAAEPVGSKFIAQAMGGNLSSATIRNELADLTELGYLEQPHTSAGRIPSPKGYRLYVNELMERRSVSDQEAAAISQALGGRMRELDSVIAQAGQLVSSIVSYPAYAAAVGKGGVTVRRFDLLPVDTGSFIAVVMTADSRVKSRLLRTDLPVEAEQLSALANLLNTHFTETGPEGMGEKLMALTGQLPPELFMPLSLAVEYAGEVMDRSARNQVFTTGQTQLLLQPEFQDPGRANELMRLLTDQKAELPVLDENTPMQILIGPENVNEALKDASVVVASYDIGENMRGLIGVVGPTRMDYAAVAARLSYFAESLTKMFGKSNQLPPKEENKS
ncbi:MAG: heat-inducible transcription repressor HrcA [Oscillospiraceae bacterium]|jgi:heat-inducible transcriptional repressor|nr:heat-inducible transcription repressor HrcA [Oscillospiraceae bacterium]MCI8720764.1 heat-inducible transcription repressor HrcA [Oscillospiraceae bacterium]MCI8943556.1 heat-inducible transcription repressor HrcA [Oscillospiraceae bacterium]